MNSSQRIHANGGLIYWQNELFYLHEHVSYAIVYIWVITPFFSNHKGTTMKIKSLIVVALALACSACAGTTAIAFTQTNFDLLPLPHTWQSASYSYSSPFQTNADGSPNGVLTPDCVVTVFSDGGRYAHDGC